MIQALLNHAQSRYRYLFILWLDIKILVRTGWAVVADTGS
jgi:hypothetical protein